MRAIWLFVFVGLVLVGADPLRSDAAEKPTPLEKTELFAIDGIGIAGTLTEAEIQFRELLRRKDAEQACLKLVRDGTPEAQLYGLLGLHLLGSSSYRTNSETLRKSDRKIHTAAGCTLYDLPASHLVRQIDQGFYDK